MLRSVVMGIRVTAEDLAHVATQLNAESQEIDSRLAFLRSSVLALTSSQWQGAASSSFDALYEQWSTSAAKLREALDGISRLLANAASAYASAEQPAGRSMG
jgi:WXG100 family type VII secretion target